MLLQPATHFSDGTVVATVLALHHGEGEQRSPFGKLATSYLTINMIVVYPPSAIQRQRLPRRKESIMNGFTPAMQLLPLNKLGPRETGTGSVCCRSIYVLPLSNFLYQKYLLEGEARF